MAVGHRAAVAGLHDQPGRVLRPAKLAPQHHDRPRPPDERGRRRHHADHGGRHRRRVRHRSVHGPAGALPDAGRPLPGGLRLPGPDRRRLPRAPVGAADGELLRRLLRQRRPEEPDRAGGRLLPGPDALHRRRLGAGRRTRRRHPRTDPGRSGAHPELVAERRVLRDGRADAGGRRHGGPARHALRPLTTGCRPDRPGAGHGSADAQPRQPARPWARGRRSEALGGAPSAARWRGAAVITFVHRPSIHERGRPGGHLRLRQRPASGSADLRSHADALDGRHHSPCTPSPRPRPW